MWESALRQSLLMSKGRFSIFLNRPISLVAFILTLALLLSPTLSFIREKKEVLKVLEKEE